MDFPVNSLHQSLVLLQTTQTEPPMYQCIFNQNIGFLLTSRRTSNILIELLQPKYRILIELCNQYDIIFEKNYLPYINIIWLPANSLHQYLVPLQTTQVGPPYQHMASSK